MRLALAQGADGIELDVRLCKSGEVVVLHDVDLKRLAGVALRAQDATLAELQAHDLGGGEHVPTLNDAIELVLGSGAQIQLNIELKPDVPDEVELVDAVTSCVEAWAKEERARLLISSFSASICREMHRQLPELAVAFLYEHEQDALSLPAGATVVHPHHALLDADKVAALHARGLRVNTWTVNDPARALYLSQAGVDAIITDDVPAILAALSSLYSL